MTLETLPLRQSAADAEPNLRPITPEEAEAGILSDLFQTIVNARIARQVLMSRRLSPSWAKTDKQSRLQAQQAIERGEEFKGWVVLPQRVSNISIPTAASIVEAGYQASLELKGRLIESKVSNLAEQYPEGAEVFERILKEAADTTVTRYRPPTGISIMDFFNGIADQKTGPGLAQLEEDARRKEAEALAQARRNQISETFSKNTGLVLHAVELLSSRITQSGLDFEDAVSEGNIGLLQAIERYNPEEGNFSSFVFPRIRGAIIDAILKYSPVPSSTLRKATVIYKFEEEFHTKNGRNPSDEEIIAGTGIAPKTLAQTRKIMDISQHSIEGQTEMYSDDALDTDREIELAEKDETVLPEERLLAQEDLNEQAMRQRTVRFILEELPPRESQILTMYHMDNMTTPQIAPVIEVSASRLVQIKTKAEKKFAAIAKSLDLDSNLQRIMARQTMALMDYLRDIGLSYATYRNYELGKGIRFKHVPGERTILVNPVQQEMIKVRLIKIEEGATEIKRQKRKKPNTRAVPEGPITLRHFLRDIGISYPTFIRHNLAEDLKFAHAHGAKTILIDSDQQEIIRTRLVQKRIRPRKRKPDLLAVQ